MTDLNPEYVGSFDEFKAGLPEMSEEELVAGYTRRLMHYKQDSGASRLTFDVGLQSMLSKITEKDI